MQYKILIILTCLTVGGVFLYSNQKHTSCLSDGYSNKALVGYKFIVGLNVDQKETFLDDTIFIWDNYIFEPVHGVQEITYSHVDSNGVITRDNARGSYNTHTLTNYYLSKLKDSAGMEFDLDSVSPRLLRTFNIKKKGLGYPVGYELFSVIGDTNRITMPLQFVYEKDTIIKQHQCVIISCTKKIPTISHNGGRDIHKKTRLILDKELKGFDTLFINKKICKQFPGTIIQGDIEMDSGITFTFQYSYQSGLTASQEILMNKYIKLYQDNIHLLDTLPSNM